MKERNKIANRGLEAFAKAYGLNEEEVLELKGENALAISVGLSEILQEKDIYFDDVIGGVDILMAPIMYNHIGLELETGAAEYNIFNTMFENTSRQVFNKWQSGRAENTTALNHLLEDVEHHLIVWALLQVFAALEDGLYRKSMIESVIADMEELDAIYEKEEE